MRWRIHYTNFCTLKFRKWISQVFSFHCRQRRWRRFGNKLQIHFQVSQEKLPSSPLTLPFHALFRWNVINAAKKWVDLFHEFLNTSKCIFCSKINRASAKFHWFLIKKIIFNYWIMSRLDKIDFQLLLCHRIMSWLWEIS